MSERLERARAAYRAYVSGDRPLIEGLLADELLFYSPADPGIDRERYFELCWPNAQNIADVQLVRLLEAGEEVIATVEVTRLDGSRFRNTEVLTFDGEKIAKIEVYFGWNLA